MENIMNNRLAISIISEPRLALYMLMGAVLCIATIVSSPATADEGNTYSGMACSAMYGDDHKLVKSGGLTNRSSSTVWVSCPVIIGNPYSIRALVDARHSGSSGVLFCQLEHSYSGSIQKSTYDYTLPGTGKDRLSLKEMTIGYSLSKYSFNTYGNVNLLCAIPPSGSIYQYMVSELDP